MKTFKSTIIFLLAELSIVFGNPNGAVITCYNFGEMSWDRIREVENPSTHRIREICPGDGDEYQRIEVKGSVKTLYEDSFKGIPELHEIQVSKTNLEEIKPETFKDLPKLDMLDLTENNLHEIKSRTFVNLKAVNLHLQKNSISVLQEGAFVNVTVVRHLGIDKNNLQELKRGVFQDLYVTQMELGSNNCSKYRNRFISF